MRGGIAGWGKCSVRQARRHVRKLEGWRFLEPMPRKTGGRRATCYRVNPDALIRIMMVEHCNPHPNLIASIRDEHEAAQKTLQAGRIGAEALARGLRRKRVAGCNGRQGADGFGCATWLERGANRPTLLFGVNQAHAQSVTEVFERPGVASAYVDCFTDNIERRQIERQFRSGEIRVVCSVRTLTTGVDWPVSCTIDAAPTRSHMLHVQKIGRGLRINDGPEDLLILDHAGISIRLGLVTDIYTETLDETPVGDRQTGQKVRKLAAPCHSCGALHRGLICPGCGNERKPVSRVTTVEGDLVEVSPKGKPADTDCLEEEQRFYAMALHLAAKRGYQPGWAQHLFRQKFGHWPARLDNTPTAPDQAFLNYEKSRRIARAKARGQTREAIA